MTDYLSGKPFSVAQRGRDPAECSHGWKDRHGRCVMCGEPIPEPQPEEGHDEPR